MSLNDWDTLLRVAEQMAEDGGLEVHVSVLIDCGLHQSEQEWGWKCVAEVKPKEVA